MAVCRVEKSNNYTVMANYHLDDRSLSLKARGLLSTMLRLPDDWDYTIAGLTALCRDGRDAIQSALKELEVAGYITRRRVRDESGVFAGVEYVVHEQPQLRPDGKPPNENTYPENPDKCAEPYPDFPDTGKPFAEKRQQPSTKRPSTKITNTPVAPKRGQRRGSIDHDSKAYLGAKYLDERICARLPDKPPSDESTLQRWAADIERINRIDGYPWELISRVLAYSQSDVFWQRNILSGAKLRKQFVTLMSHMSRGSAPPGKQKTLVVENQEVEEW